MAKEEWPSGPGFYINLSKGAAIVHKWSPELVAALVATGARGVRIQPDWPDPHLEALTQVRAQLEKVVVEADIRDLSALGALTRLREASIRDAAETIDFSRLPSLESLSVWSREPSFGNLRECAALRALTITNCGLEDLRPLAGLSRLVDLVIREAPLGSLLGMEELPSLRRLVLHRVPMSTLDGIENVPSLPSVVLFWLRSLTSIEPLTRLHSLRALAIDGMRRIPDLAKIGTISSLEELRLIGVNLTNVDFLSGLVALRTLVLANVGKIPSLSFIRRLSKLEGLVLDGGTTIEDGDLSPVLDLPVLVRASYTERRHYKPRKGELQAALDSKSQR